jgi:hypothetical protein
MKQSLFVIAILALYLLHQDFWFWRAAAPVVLGFLPVGLFYHVCYTLVISALMWALVKFAWPSRLDERAGEDDLGSPAPRRPGALSQTEGRDA